MVASQLRRVPGGGQAYRYGGEEFTLVFPGKTAAESMPHLETVRRAIEAYLRAEEPYDTAGSAKAESLGIALMESIQSDDPTAIIGLPLIELTRMLTRFGLDPLDAPGASE
ncbi:hypothetical protein G6F63_015548 [Rhizopus arrhizus]|nr:hypothetical protein G6F63_015548 [Rhizopus arrhizus]